MPWQKTSDGAATHPKLMQVAALPRADERTVNEVSGWLWRCSTQSALHMTDYLVDVGTALMLGGSRATELVRLARRAGLLEEVRVDGLRCYKLLEDEDLWHIRSRAEIEWDRTQRNDTRDPKILVPVVLRDGDNCRWCGVLTQWRGPRNARTHTYDHLVPGQPGTPETVVVACWSCNSAKQENPRWADDHELRDAPRVPLYSRWAVEYLGKHGYPEITQNVLRDDVRPAPADGADPAPRQGVRPATGPSDDPAPRAPAARGARRGRRGRGGAR